MRKAVGQAALSLLLLMGCALAHAAHAERRVALVIGNGGYENAPHLANPVHDAKGVVAALKKLGFVTVLSTDLGQAAMQDAEIRFARAADGADVALFYYSGHAMQFNGVNYLMPVDAKLRDEADLHRFVRVDQIVADLQEAKNLRILILDSCRDNPLADVLRRSSGATRGAALTHGLAPIASPQGMIVAFSTQAGKTAEDGSGFDSPYTTAFLKHIGERAEIGRVFRRISADVYQATDHKQLPELSLSLIGEYYLRGAPADDARPLQPTPGADEVAWDGIKDTASPAMLDAFIAKFPNSKFAPFAEARSAELRKKQEAAAAGRVNFSRKGGKCIVFNGEQVCE